MRATAETYNWNLSYGDIALLWRGGCIIRSTFLSNIKEAFDSDPKLENLLLAPFFRDAISNAQDGWRRVCAAALTNGVAIPAFASALTYFDGYRSARLPANLLQAQRDYFGAHTYERIDKPRGEMFHSNWSGHGGTTASSAYNV
jgi:6-phosphogluconate dehydrogenase